MFYSQATWVSRFDVSRRFRLTSSVREVFSEIEAMFRRDEEDRPNSCRAGPEGMSLFDKMSMWDSKAGEDLFSTEKEDLYQGVKDIDDEIIDGSAYHSAIINSAAYEWFLKNLKKECSLQWSPTQSRVMIDSIREIILAKLPTKTISKRRTLPGYEIEFSLEWNSEMAGELGDGLLGFWRPGVPLSELITVTGSAEDAQVLTIKDYLTQTWPLSGPRLLEVLQNTIAHPYRHYSGRI